MTGESGIEIIAVKPDQLLSNPDFIGVLERELEKQSPLSEVRLFFTILADEEGKKDPSMRDIAESAIGFYMALAKCMKEQKDAMHFSSIQSPPAEQLRASMACFTPAQQKALKIIMGEYEPDIARKTIQRRRLIGGSVSALSFIAACITGAMAIGEYRQMQRFNESPPPSSVQIDTQRLETDALPLSPTEASDVDTNKNYRRAMLNFQNDGSMAVLLALAGLGAALFTSKICKMDSDYMGMVGSIDCNLLLDTTNQFLANACKAYQQRQTKTTRA
jgi:hypothetical protein